MPFAGLPPEALTFYAGLEADNTRDYWQAHKDVYEDAVREPMEELIAELGPEFGTAKIFRPYRNLRFSKDKTPYKTSQAAVMTEDGSLAGRYLDINASGLRLGSGLFHIPSEELARIRKGIDDEQSGEELQQIKDELERGGLSYHPPDLKTAPRGYPKDHPRVELLRRKNHIASTHLEPGPWLHSAEAKDRIAAEWRKLTPLLAWLDRHVAA
jgi:uncharacterized protein (TIGR02453 family)